MASEGPNSGATFANDAGVGSVAWSLPENAAASDNTKSNAVLFGTTSNYLKATNFGFSIPAGATIDGIVVEVEHAESSPAADISDGAIRIVKGGVIGTTDKSNVAEWPTADAYQTYGGASDKWGETWTADDINATTFGCAVSAVAVGSGSATIDHIRITVYYTEASTGRSRMSTLMCG